MHISTVRDFRIGVLFVSTICRAIESIERLLADCIVETGNCQLRHLLKQEGQNHTNKG
jgi:hypothetical protein